MRIETERVVLREVARRDLRALLTNMNNINIARGLVGVPHPYTEKEAQWWINHAMYERTKRPRTEYILAITKKPEDTMIGEIMLREIDSIHKKATLVYWLSEDHWRQGLVSEALPAMMNVAFTQLKLRRLEISAFAENTASARLATKLGFTYEGTQRKASYAESTGTVHDDNVYSMLDCEYLDKYGNFIPVSP